MRSNLNPVTGKVFPVFLCYAVPSIIGMLAMTCAVVVDGFFLGNYAGTTALASVNLTIPASGLLFGIALMFSVGGAVRCGKYIGAGNNKAANGSFSQTIVFVFFISVVLTVLGITYMDELVFLLGADKTLAPIVAEYLNILLIFTVFQLGAVCLSYFVRVANLPFWASGAMITGCFANVLLDWLFVVQLEMGHKGAALGTGLAETITFLLLSAPFLAQRAQLKFYWRRRDLSELLKAAINGIPEFFDEFSIGIVMFIFNWMIMKKLGHTGVAAFSIINYMILVGLVISYGISDSLQSVVSQNFGALKHKRIKVFLTLSMASVFVVGIIISILLVMIPHSISDLFIQAGETKTISLTNHFIARVWPVFIFNGVNIVLAAYLTAMHRCLDSTLIILSKNLIFPVLFLFVINIMIDQDAILIVLPLSELATFCIGIGLLYKNKLKKIAPTPKGLVPRMAIS